MDTESEGPKPTLSVRINQIDHVLMDPGALDHGAVRRVPILRVFGTSTRGPCLAYIHQVYPYFFVEYKGSMDPQTGVSKPDRLPFLELTPAESEPIYS